MPEQEKGIEHPGELFDGVWWKCPRCPGGYVSSRDPELLAEKTDEHLQDQHGISLEEYQKRGGFDYAE